MRFKVCVILLFVSMLPAFAAVDSVALQLKWKHQFQFAGYYAAIEKGYYKDAGLHVRLIEALDSTDSFQNVLQGKAQFGVASSDIVIQRGKGVPVVLLANIFQHSPWIFLAIENRGINNVHDLSGKKIMVDSHGAELLAYLQSESISLDDIEFVQHSFTNKELIEGTVDAINAYSTDEPYVLEQLGYPTMQFNPRASGIDFYGDVLYTTEQEISLHPKQVKAFLNASLLGWKYAVSHTDEMVDLIYEKYSKRHSKEQLRYEAEKTVQLIAPDIIELGYINEGRWQRIAEIYSELNMMHHGVSMNKFIYERNPRPNLVLIYAIIAGVLLLLIVVLFFTIRYYTFLKRLERETAERRDTENQLRLLEERYRIVVENAPFSIIISKFLDGEMLYVNTQMSNQFEISKVHAVGKKTSMLYANRNDRKKIIEILNNQGYLHNYEVLLKTASGREFWASLSVSVITFANEKASFVGVVDITQQKELEINLKKANEIKDTFFSILAHDLRTPIGNFYHVLDLLVNDEQRFSNPDIQKQTLSALLESSKSTFLLLENLLAWSRSQRGILEFNPTHIELLKMAEEVANIFLLAAQKKHINVQLDIPAKLNVIVDRDMLHVVLRNLLSNAIKFTSENGNVLIYAKSSKGGLLLGVKDDGVGMEPETIEAILRGSNVFSTYGTNYEKGSGLGLNLCVDFIQKHGGQLNIESAPGKGSHFTFTFPPKYI